MRRHATTNGESVHCLFCMAGLSKKPTTVIEDEDALLDAMKKELDMDEALLTSEGNAIAHLSQGNVLVWPNGNKIPAQATRRAYREAKRLIEASMGDVPKEATPRREPTELALKFAPLKFDPDAMCPVESRVSGNSGWKAAVHHPATFTIEAYDGTATRLNRGGDTFFIHIRGPARVRGRTTDNGDGSYQCTWTPPLSGTYQIAVSCFGIAIQGSPFLFEATTPLPFAPNCVASGPGLTLAVARATQTFDVEFKDRLSFVTHAVDLDVYLETMPVGTAVATGSSATKKTAVDDGTTRTVESGGDPGPRRRGSISIQAFDESDFDESAAEEDGEEEEFVRQRTVRYKVKSAPLVIRATDSLDSPEIGMVYPGQMMTIVMEKVSREKVRAMIALASIGRQAEVIGEAQHNNSGLVAGPAQSDLQPDELMGVTNSQRVKEFHLADDDIRAYQEIALAANEGATQALEGQIGWVTTIKNGKRFVTSKVRQSTISRQLQAEQWVRRLATDRALSKAKGSVGEALGKVQLLPSSSNVDLEKNADPSGIGFAFGGIFPGTLHAKGKLIDVHKASYSVGRVGAYLLHVRLRQQAVPLPGSPFRLEVVPNEANALSTTLPDGLISGLVGSDAESGCGITIKTFDLMGNACIAGGAPITANPIDKSLTESRAVTVAVKDNEDGTYYLHWRANASGTYDVAIKIANAHVVGSPTSIIFTSIAPQHQKTVVYGDGLQFGTAGEPSRFSLKFFVPFTMHSNPLSPTHTVKAKLVRHWDRAGHI